jgi:hypothetical protein
MRALRHSLAAASVAAIAVAALRLGEGAASADVFFDVPRDAAVPDEGGVTTAQDAGTTPMTAPSAAPVPAALDAAAGGMVLMLPQVAVSDAEAPPAPLLGGSDASAPAVLTDAGTEYTGLSVGIRAGFALPAGHAKSSDLSDVVKYEVPIGIELGYYLRPNFYVGGYFTYAFAGTSKTAQSVCPTGTDTTCNAQSYKAGLVAEYAFRHTTKLSPWVRFGMGLDVLNLTATDNTGTTVQSSALTGFEWATLSGGLDWKNGYFYGIGPYAELALGDYGNKGGFADPHLFFSFGLRGRTGLFIP